MNNIHKIENKTVESGKDIVEREKNNEQMAREFEYLIGDEKSNRLYNNLLRALRSGGKEQAKIFLWNESDKFRNRPDMIDFFERRIFNAGDLKLDTETPWNMIRRMKALKEKK